MTIAIQGSSIAAAVAIQGTSIAAAATIRVIGHHIMNILLHSQVMILLHEATLHHIPMADLKATDAETTDRGHQII